MPSKVIGKNLAPNYITKAVFEILLCKALGFLPEMDFCGECHKKTPDGFFVPFEGYILCPACNSATGRQSIYLKKDLLSAIKRLFEMDSLLAFGIRSAGEEDKNAFVKMAEDFAKIHLDCATKALDFYHNSLKYNFED